jgi:hypothetical protein
VPPSRPSWSPPFVMNPKDEHKRKKCAYQLVQRAEDHPGAGRSSDLSSSCRPQRCRVRSLIGHSGSRETVLNRWALSSNTVRRSTVSRFAVCAILAVSAPIALTACSSSGASESRAAYASSVAADLNLVRDELRSDSASSTGPSSTGPSSMPSAVGPPMTDRLTAIVLKPSDLPAGWVGSAHIPVPNSVANAAALVSCIGGRNTYPDETGESDSLDYSMGTATIGSVAKSFRSQADVTDETANIDNPKRSGCSQNQVAARTVALLPPGVTLESLSIAFIAGPGGGPSNVIATAVSKEKESDKATGKTTILYVSATYIVGPLTYAVITFGSLGAPLPTTITSPLIAKVAARAAAPAAA